MNRPARLLTVLLVFGTLSSTPPTALALDEPPPVETVEAESGEPEAPDGLSYDTPPGCTHSSFSAYQNTGQTIPDAADGAHPGIITSTINMSALNVFPWLWRVTATTDITHTNNSNLEIYLVSPQGTKVTLTTDNGGTFNNGFHGTAWSDKAGETAPPGPVTQALFANNVAEANLVPEEAFGAFVGENPIGDWKLVVVDDEHLDTGRLNNWSLQLTTLAVEPAHRNVTVSTFPSNAIPDDGTQLTVTVNLPDWKASLGELKLTYFVTHTQPSDLVLDLVQPSGDIITLSGFRGGNKLDIFNGTLWSDKAGATNPPGPVTDNTLVSGVLETPLVPEEAMGAAYGTNPAGTWVVRVRDAVPNGQTGRRNSVHLAASYYTCLPDLESTQTLPQFVRLGTPLPIKYEVLNWGADAGTVFLTGTLPAKTTFISAGGAGWTCSGPAVGSLGGHVYCNRPSLAHFASASVTVLAGPSAQPEDLGTAHVIANTLGEIHYNDNSDFGPAVSAAGSANGNPWDVHDSLRVDAPFNSGGLTDGGQEAFDNWGQLRLYVRGPGGVPEVETDELQLLSLAFDPSQHWHSTLPLLAYSVFVTRKIYAPPNANWLRYVDTFTNTASTSRTLVVAWGGELSSIGDTQTAATSSGNNILTAEDTWAVIDQDHPALGIPPVAFALRSPTDTTYQGPGLFSTTPFTTHWPAAGNSNLGHNFQFVVTPHTTASLAYFVYRGLAEGEAGPEDCDVYGGCITPAAGSQAALAESIIASLAEHPYFCDLSAAERALIWNWPGAVLACPIFVPVVVR